MREGMRRAICAVYVKHWEDRLCYWKHNGIVQCHFQNFSQRYGEVKAISVKREI